jgi:transcriptional regulator with XRE-family HTH domain
MDNDSFWGRVKKLLKAHKLTQAQFAQYIDIPLKSLEGMIYYDRIPIVYLAIDIATALGVTVEYLAYGKDSLITDKRLKELAARQSALRISGLAQQIQNEADEIKSKKQPTQQ